MLVFDLKMYQKIETMSDNDVFSEYEKLFKAARRMRKKLGIEEQAQVRRPTDADSAHGSTNLSAHGSNSLKKVSV